MAYCTWFCSGVITEIQKLWPGTVLVTGMPQHSESNGGVERRNRAMKEEISNWMHANKSTHWAQCLPFIQWQWNTQIHRGIGGRTPYHLMFGQKPQVGISSLPIDQSLFQSSATEADINRHLGLAPNVPLEDATMMISTSKLPEEKHSIGFKTPEEDFHSEGFKTDVTEAFVTAMVKKATVLVVVGNRRYFGWKGLGFQCGVCYSSVPLTLH